MTRSAFLVRAELAIGAIAALLPVLLFVAAPDDLRPMFDDRPSVFGVPQGVVTLVLGFSGAIAGWIWMIRISRELSQPDRVTWRRSAFTERRRWNLHLAVAALISIAIAAFAVVILLSLPLDAPRVRLRTIAEALVAALVIAASMTALAWIVMTAWCGGDER